MLKVGDALLCRPFNIAQNIMFFGENVIEILQNMCYNIENGTGGYIMKNLSLEKNWFIATDKNNVGKSEGWEKCISPDAVPAFVPSIIQQFFPEYHGVAYYWCSFVPELEVGENEQIILRFGGADYLAQVWLNSVYLGYYEGGETPFTFDVTGSIKLDEENLLAVRIINPCERDIDGLNLMNTPHRNKVTKKKAGSCLNHGGLWYGVSLTVLPKIYVDDKFLIGNIESGEIKAKITLSSKAADVCDAAVTVTVYENKFSDKLVSASKLVSLTPGSCETTCTVKVENHKLWSVDEPNLYRVEVTVDSKYGTHTSSVKFGFREFKVKDGFFYLNGKKIFIKSSHSGNAFPVGQMMPVYPEHLQRDFIYAKAAGFNMLRCIAGLFRPEQLDLADEIGLLIYDECYASWCVGFSQWEQWHNKEEYEAVSAKYPEFSPLGDEKTMLERWRGATEKMILRDRNHPSVVIWGLLNETKDNSIFRAAIDFLPRARELDPSRFIILNSGRFDFDFSIGSASNPYSYKWENTWGVDGHPELFNTEQPYKWTSDNHHYARVPMSDDDMNFFRTFGKDSPLPYFLSEFGIGPQFHVIEEWKHFMQYGERADLEDASWLHAQSDAFTRDFYRLGLEKLFAFPESVMKESQRINADDRKRVFDLLRSNPNLPGYSLTGLFDHGMCGEGLWSYWRRWKPEMFDAISDGFEKLRFCLFATASVASGDELILEASLANDGVLKSGIYNADFAIISDTGVHLSFSESFELDGDKLASPIMKKTIAADLPEGNYKFVASLREGSPAGTSVGFSVFDNAHLDDINCGLAYVGLNEATTAKIKRFNPNAREYDGKNPKVIIAGRVGKQTLAELINTARLGTKVFFIERDIFFDDANIEELRRVVSDISVMKHRSDWLYHKDYILAERDIFGFTGDKLATLWKFGPVFANQAFSTEKTPDRVLAPGFVSGFYDVEGAYASFHAMMGFDYGLGEVYMNSFKIMDNIAHPVAERLLYNIIKYLEN